MSKSGLKTKGGSRLNRHFKPKPRAFIIFTDLDGTFTPIGLEGLKDFADVVKEITEREKVQVINIRSRLIAVVVVAAVADILVHAINFF